MSGGFKFIDGGPFQRPDDVIIDDFYANQKKKKVGDTIKIHESWTGTSAASSRAACWPIS